MRWRESHRRARNVDNIVFSSRVGLRYWLRVRVALAGDWCAKEPNRVSEKRGQDDEIRGFMRLCGFDLVPFGNTSEQSDL